MTKNHKGFGSIELLLLLAIVAILGFVGWFVYDSNKKANLSLNSSNLSTPALSSAKKIVAVGDIACDPEDVYFASPDPGHCQSKATHALAASLKPEAVLALGDLQYENGALEKFMRSYDSDWGQDKKITYPAAGNHEYATASASGYFNYFNGSQPSGRAGEAGKGYYSFNLGKWHIIALNSNCQDVGGCGEDSPQLAWLKQDLARAAQPCTLAFWHHPRFSSGKYAQDTDTLNRGRIFWEVLSKHKADVVLNGHDHLYERFAMQTSTGLPSDSGIRQFTVGTGGKVLYQQKSKQANSQKVIDNQFGVLAMELYSKAYKWSFVSSDSKVLDAGHQQCVN